MNKTIVLAVTMVLVLSAFLVAAAPVHAAPSGPGECRGLFGYYTGSQRYGIASAAQQGGIRRGPDSCDILYQP